MREGRYKDLSNSIRKASKLLDLFDLPFDLALSIPIVGEILVFLDDIAAVGTCLLAGTVDIAGCLRDRDFPGAAQEGLECLAETLLVAAPGLGSVQMVFDLRQYLRDKVGQRCRSSFNPAPLRL